MQFLPLLIAALVACGSGIPIQAASKEAREKQFPAQIYVQVDKSTGGSVSCEGTLLTSRHVVTAAHCIQAIKLGGFGGGGVAMGGFVDAKDITNANPRGAQGRMIYGAVAHSEFNKTGNAENDVAVLMVYPDFDITDYLSPITILADDSGFIGSPKATVSSYGIIKGEEGTLRYAEVNLVNHDSCNAAWSGKADIGDTQICVDFSGKDRDYNAAPLQVQADDKWIQLGLSSFGQQTQKPDVYTRVSKHCSFLKEATDGIFHCA